MFEVFMLVVGVVIGASVTAWFKRLGGDIKSVEQGAVQVGQQAMGQKAKAASPAAPAAPAVPQPLANPK